MAIAPPPPRRLADGRSARAASPFGGRRAGRPPLAVSLTFVPWIALFVLFTLGPALAIIPISFTDLNGYPGIPVNWVGAKNYLSFFGPSHWSDTEGVLIRTAVFCVVVSVLTIAGSLGVAILLTRRMRGSTLWRAIVFLPTILGVTVNGLMWTLVLNPTSGPVAAVAKWLHVQTALLGDSRIAFTLVILITVWSSLGYATVIFIAALQGIPEDYYEAASIDGASGWQQFRHVTFPLLTPAVTVNVLLAVIGSLQAYQLIYVLTNGKFDTSVLASVVLQSGFQGGTSQGYAAAVSVVQFLLILVVTILIYVPLRRREARLEA